MQLFKRCVDVDPNERASVTDVEPQLQHKIERNESAFTFNPAIDDVYCVSSFLKVCSHVCERTLVS